MTKINGVFGYAIQEETAPGVWSDTIVEKPFSGDLLQNANRWEASGKVNDNISFDNKISVLGNPYTNTNWQFMKFVRLSTGAAWKISKVEIVKPRLILTMGGIYHES